MSLNDNNLSNLITHTGVIGRIDNTTRSIGVSINDNKENCSSCPVIAVCSAGKNSNIIEITVDDISQFRVGQTVNVTATEKMHKRAITLLTFLPCVALIATMVAIFLILHDELIAVLSGLGMTVAFFLILFIFRNRIAKDYNFIITPTQ